MDRKKRRLNKDKNERNTNAKRARNDTNIQNDAPLPLESEPSSNTDTNNVTNSNVTSNNVASSTVASSNVNSTVAEIIASLFVGRENTTITRNDLANSVSLALNMPINRNSNLLSQNGNENNRTNSTDTENGNDTDVNNNSSTVDDDANNWQNLGRLQFSIYLPGADEEIIFDVYINYDASTITNAYSLLLDYLRKMFCTLSKNEISKIKQYKYKKTDDYVDCTICMDQLMDEEMVRELACKHVFHCECVDSWLMNYNNKCPVCRCSAVKTESVGREK